MAKEDRVLAALMQPGPEALAEALGILKEEGHLSAAFMLVARGRGLDPQECRVLAAQGEAPSLDLLARALGTEWDLAPTQLLTEAPADYLKDRPPGSIAWIGLPWAGGWGLLGLERASDLPGWSPAELARFRELGPLFAVASSWQASQDAERHEALNHLTALGGAARILHRKLAGPLTPDQVAFTEIMVARAGALVTLFSGGPRA